MQAGNPFPSNEKWLLISLGLHSAAIIAFQLSLMQLISIVQWHHFAYMVISIAMLGFGASGTLLSLTRKRILRHAKWIVPSSMALSGILMMLVFPLSRGEILRFDVFLLFSGGGGWLNLLLTYLWFFLPFFSGSLAIGIIFIQKSSRIGNFYFSNLLGSSLGGILALVIMNYFFPTKGPLLIGLLSLVSGAILAGRMGRLFSIPIALIGLLLTVWTQPAEPQISEYKALAKTLHLPEAEVSLSKPSIYGLVEVVHSSAQRYAPAVSLKYGKEIPGGHSVFVNGNYYGPVIPYEVSRTDHILDYTTQMLPYLNGKKERVLCINAGTGVVISHALSNGAQQVDAVIENHAVTKLMKGELREESGNLFHLPEVEIYRMQSRAFLTRESTPDYDLIVLPLFEGFGGTSGVNALREEYSYTQEAFIEMLEHLKPDGMLAVSTWQDYPPRTSLKIPATLAQAAIATGVENPRDHLAAIRSWGSTTFVLKQGIINAGERENIRAFCQEMFFDPLLLPDLREEERQQYNLLEDIQYFENLDKIVEGDFKALPNYGFAIEPSTDDQPYFSQFLRLKSLKHIAGVFGWVQIPFLELGYLTLLVTLLQSIILSVILIVLPLLALKKATSGKTATLVYFGALGIGYMFAEIILIQRFVLYLGEPVFAVTAVISTMMLFSGLGSLLSQKRQASISLIRRLALLISALLLMVGFGLTPLIRSTLSLAMPWKALISVMAIGTPSFFMGMLFPLGIRLLSKKGESQIAWAWGINACLSVISTSLATLIAVEKGFQIVLMAAGLAYFFAALAFSLQLKIFPKKSVS
ncbi:MAG: hypothetical protein V2I46_01820 [Bacteroides sp.]|jgi:hypothetical protein|nr:hypothetical protein [Bacteroides sp.]